MTGEGTPKGGATTEHSDSTTVALGELHANDYNPRADAGTDIDTLADSIESEGLIQALAVRESADGYEVISGERRLQALRSLYDEDYQVPVTVRDVGDDQARRLALAENIEREDLTPIEEAWGFAEGVTVEVDGEEMTYAEYVENLRGLFSEASEHWVVLPSQDHGEVKREAQATPRSADYIRDHLSFLTLPEGVRDQIAAGDFPKRAARLIVRTEADTVEGRDAVIRALAESFEDGVGNSDWGKFKALYQLDIPDAEAKAEAVRRITEQVGGNITDDSVDESRIKRLIESAEQRYEERQDLKAEELEQKRQLVATREDDLLSELSVGAEFAREAFGATFAFGAVNDATDVDGVYTAVKSTLADYKTECQDRATDAGQRVNDLTSRSARLTQALDILREEPEADTDTEWFRDLVTLGGALDDEIAAAEDAQAEALEQRRTVQDYLDDIRHAHRQLQTAQDDLAALESEVDG